MQKVDFVEDPLACANPVRLGLEFSSVDQRLRTQLLQPFPVAFWFPARSVHGVCSKVLNFERVIFTRTHVFRTKVQTGNWSSPLCQGGLVPNLWYYRSEWGLSVNCRSEQREEQTRTDKRHPCFLPAETGDLLSLMHRISELYRNKKTVWLHHCPQGPALRSHEIVNSRISIRELLPRLGTICGVSFHYQSVLNLGGLLSPNAVFRPEPALLKNRDYPDKWITSIAPAL